MKSLPPDAAPPRGPLQKFMVAMTRNVARLDDRDGDPRLHRWRIDRPIEEVVRYLDAWVRRRKRWQWADGPPPAAGSLTPAAGSTAPVANSPEAVVEGPPAVSDGSTPVMSRLEHRSAVFQFVDDVEITLTPAGGRTVVDAVSRSRIGKGDLGQNRRNLIDLRSGFDLK